MCKWVLFNKPCPDRDECQFAHSAESLRCTDMYLHTNMCRAVVRAGGLASACNKGQLCTFAHSQAQMDAARERQSQLLEAARVAKQASKICRKKATAKIIKGKVPMIFL